jgi:hypothetical protein
MNSSLIHACCWLCLLTWLPGQEFEDSGNAGTNFSIIRAALLMELLGEFR